MSVKTPGGAPVYHPELDSEIRSYPGGRVFLVRQLKTLADEANTAGDNRLKVDDYDGANRLWSIGARYLRASMSIGYGKPTDPDDYKIVGTAWRGALQALTRQKME